jgi:UDP-N-acetylglucosamine 3-dehydrogenase
LPWHASLPLPSVASVRSLKTIRHKVAVVGMGTMGRRHARVLSGLPERFHVAGVYDPRRDVEPPPELARFATEAEAIAAADVVVYATPTGAHSGGVARALGAGRHVLVEKPLCATRAEADALVAIARGREKLFVGHSERFNPVVRALARLVRGESVVALDFQRVGPTRPGDCSVLVNLGVHDLDLAAYLGGGAVALRGAVGGDDFAHVLIETEGGALGHVHVDRTGPHRRRSLILSTAGWIYEGDLLAHRLVRTSRETGVRTEVPVPLEEPLAAQARALADALEGASVREIATGADGAAAVALAEAATLQCLERGPRAAPRAVDAPPSSGETRREPERRRGR